MKKLLLTLVLFTAGYGAFAQATCAAAVNITANGTFTTGAINGTYVTGCYTNTTDGATGAPMRARWWKYTPTSNGEITVTSAIAPNPSGTTGTDSRVSILRGTCTALTCVDSNDDVSDTDYRSTVTVPVAAGTTYYIEWDSNWQATTFSFQFTFEAADCIRPGRNEFYRPGNYTTTDATVAWINAIGEPASYDVDWSIGLDDAAGTGTIVNVPAAAIGTPPSTAAALTGLPESQNFRYYVRSNCGDTQSAWQGPNLGYLAVPLPYTNDFGTEANSTDGFVGFSIINTNAAGTPPFFGDGDTGRFMFTPNSTTAVSDRWAYSRAISLVAGETVTVNFKTRAYVGTVGATPSDMTLDVTVGQAQSAASQTEVLTSITENNLDAYTPQTATFTAIEDGIYYFGFHNNSPIGAVQTFLFFDTLDFSSTLGVNSFSTNDVSVYPNPAKNIISITNSLNATVDSIEMTDLNGRVVKSQKVNATEAQVNISDLSVGVYMMKIKTDQGIATKKVIKE